MKTPAPLPKLRMESIAQIYSMIGRPPPRHPHLAVIAATWHEPLRVTVPIAGRRIESSLYAVSLKRGDECHVEFGRQRCDGQSGTLVFLAPGQALIPLSEEGDAEAKEGDGWTIVFHPELLRGTPLAETMHRFRFFGYAAREALHLTRDESDRFTNLVRSIEGEAEVGDAFADDVLAAQLQVLFSYCQRAYARQFEVRARKAGSVAAQLDRHLDAWLASAPSSTPTVRSCAKALGYSADYLSDLLRAETGHSARTHIHTALIEAAKARLLAEDARASDVAYALGFEHPQGFTRLFRQLTGHSPAEWRRAQRLAR